jgi:predicted AlkP superfamily pyrophosphatase or phosphodiesterase
MLHSRRHRLLSITTSLFLAAAPAMAREHGRLDIDQVVLISVDGLHAIDVQNYIESHPHSAFARLARRGVTYTNASTSSPSDSFPGVLALVTGGSPVSHQVFYDVSYDRNLFDPSNTTCSGAPGTVPTFDETIDLIDASGNDLNVIDPTHLPNRLTPDGKCVRVFPHDFIRSNTIFEVIRQHGQRTAWADKHPAYDLVNGPSGKGVDDLYTPEITNPVGFDATVSVVCTVENDNLKVTAVVNEIHGKDHAGNPVGRRPAIMGMNFQAVSVGQKLAHDKGDPTRCNPADTARLLGKPGGYIDGRATPTEVLAYGLDKTDAALERILDALEEERILDSTLVIVSAKHGQSPIDPAKTNKPGGIENLIAALPDGNTPVAMAIASAPGISEDDGALIWLADESLTREATDYLNLHARELFIQEVLSGDSLKLRFNDPRRDGRTPDLIVIPTYGTIYSASKKKNAEHGGFQRPDTNVGLIVSNPRFRGRKIKSPVETSQVAATILDALGFNPEELEAVRREHTEALPGLLGEE